MENTVHDFIKIDFIYKSLHILQFRAKFHQ